MDSEYSLSTLRICIDDLVDLGVRVRGSVNPDLPENLYQRLPVEAMSLMATVPSGHFAVSIPQRGLGYEYRIHRTPPKAEEHFTIVYARRGNGRYEAVEIVFSGKTDNFMHFCETARRRLAERYGELKPIPDKYAYFAPARNRWAVVLRDSGYAAIDPTHVPDAMTSDLNQYREVLKGEVLARVPVYAGNGQPGGRTLPVFARVELTCDLPENRNSWIGFEDYKKARAQEARPPEAFVSDFREWLAKLTAEAGFESWEFRRGTLFGDRAEWWGDGSRRRTEHEGIDFVEGMGSDGAIRTIPEGTPVRAITDGEVTAILDDFLGKTAVMVHPEIRRDNDNLLCTFISHILPAQGLGGSIVKGQPIGKVGKSAAVKTPAHLHLTAAWIPKDIGPNAITLDHIHPANTSVTLINLNDLLGTSPSMDE